MRGAWVPQWEAQAAGGKRKGPFASEQPKSREETPKVGCNAGGKTAGLRA
jgi:hypothetical protein